MSGSIGRVSGESTAALVDALMEKEEELRLLDEQLNGLVSSIIERGFPRDLVQQFVDRENDEHEVEKDLQEIRRKLIESKQRARRDILTQEQARRGISSDVLKPMSESMLRSMIDSRMAPSRTSSKSLGHNIGTWLTDYSSIELTRTKLGEGAFGAVMKGKWHGKEVAIKTITPSWEESNLEDTIADFRNECATMVRLLHPNIVLFMGLCIKTEPKLQLVMITELMARGSVADIFYEREERPALKVRLAWAKQVALGLNAMHRCVPTILHLDLKPHNVLIDRHNIAKVADFGLAKVRDPEKNIGKAGSPFYMAPEVLTEKPYDERADVYSFGILLWEFVTQSIPYIDRGFTNFRDIIKAVVDNLERPDMPTDISKPLQDLISRLWAPTPEGRPSFQEVIDEGVLDKAFVDHIISEANVGARAFWLLFSDKDSYVPDKVSWPTFAKTIKEYTGMTVAGRGPVSADVRWCLFQKVLAPEGGDITIERFDKVLGWFGPWNRGDNLLENVMAIAKTPGFYGDVAPDRAQHLMGKMKPGTYMIRFSGGAMGNFTVTSVAKNKRGAVELKNFRVQHLGDTMVTLEGHDESWRDIAALVKSKKKEWGLKKALPGGPYADLIASSTKTFDNNYIAIPDLQQKKGKGKRK